MNTRNTDDRSLYGVMSREDVTYAIAHSESGFIFVVKRLNTPMQEFQLTISIHPFPAHYTYTGTLPNVLTHANTGEAQHIPSLRPGRDTIWNAASPAMIRHLEILSAFDRSNDAPIVALVTPSHVVLTIDGDQLGSSLPDRILRLSLIDRFVDGRFEDTYLLQISAITHQKPFITMESPQLSQISEAITYLPWLRDVTLDWKTETP